MSNCMESIHYNIQNKESGCGAHLSSTGISALRRLRQNGRWEFKAIWATNWDPVLKTKQRQQTTYTQNKEMIKENSQFDDFAFVCITWHAVNNIKLQYYTIIKNYSTAYTKCTAHEKRHWGSMKRSTELYPKKDELQVQTYLLNCKHGCC